MNGWTRRQFLAVSSAAALRTSAAGSLWAQVSNAKSTAATEAESRRPVLDVMPLLEGNTARPLRYHPVAGEFVIKNGTEFFNRPIYGPLSDFRIDAGDLPEFSLYMPGHGGNLKLGIVPKYVGAPAAPVATPAPPRHSAPGQHAAPVRHAAPHTTAHHAVRTPSHPMARRVAQVVSPRTGHPAVAAATPHTLHALAAETLHAASSAAVAPMGQAETAAGRHSGKWLAQADEVIARYRPGRMLYEIRDSLLGSGVLTLELLTAGTGSGVLLRIESKGMPPDLQLAWAFAGSSGRKGRMKGDLGCEDEPVAQFFQVRAEECASNSYSFETTTAANGRSLPAVRLRSRIADQVMTFPTGSALEFTDFSRWALPPQAALASTATATSTAPQPILVGSIALSAAPLILRLQRVKSEKPLTIDDPAVEFAERSKGVDAIATTIVVESPDEYLNAAVPALSVATEAIWDEKLGTVMHGAVAWRTPIVGWRGPYALDALGEHERARENLRHWLRQQNVKPIAADEAATGPFDPDSDETRKETLLHTLGDVSNSHYDMNHILFNVLQRHLRWTGDDAFARETWPAFKRHLAWQRRLFRRIFTLPFGEHAPLYEAYGAMWASDDLQYNGGGTTYSSAYQLMALRFGLQMSDLFREDPTPYLREIQQLQRGMQELLWLPQQGMFAESRGIMGPNTAFNNPGLWTVYHAIDCEAASPRQAWEMVSERLHTLRRIPVHGPSVPPGPWFLLSNSNWVPSQASLNTIATAENAHMALAMWQAGMPDDAYALLKGALLDSMFQGLCPGNLHMTSELDVSRQEQQRDFGDPIGAVSRALVEGLFGVRPDLMRNQIVLAPGFPKDWNRASLRHKDFDLRWERNVLHETYEFTSRFSGAVPVTLRLPARTTSWPQVNNGSEPVRFAFDSNAVGAPVIVIEMPAVPTFKLSIDWHGDLPTAIPAFRRYRVGVALDLPAGVALAQIDDPEHCLTDGRIAARGIHTVFANVHESNCKWSLPITFDVGADSSLHPPVPRVAFNEKTEMLDLSDSLMHQVTQIFARTYSDPRPTTCSLAIPDTLLGGWTTPGSAIRIDDKGLRGAGGMLATGIGVPFRTPEGSAPNCRFLSFFKPDQAAVAIPLTGNAAGIYFLLTGTTLPQFSHMDHVLLTATYADGTTTRLGLRSPETWWPIEQDYLLDDYVFVNDAPLPPRVDLRTGRTRLLEQATFKGKGRVVPGGAATISYLPLDPVKKLASVKVEVLLYGVVAALLGASLVRPAS